MIAFKIIETLAPFVEAFLGIWINTEVLGEGAEKNEDSRSRQSYIFSAEAMASLCDDLPGFPQ